MKRTINRNQTGLRHDKKKALRFYFDGKPYYGLEGDTLESALLANNVVCFGYSKIRGQALGTGTTLSHRSYVTVKLKHNQMLIAPPSDILLTDGLHGFLYNKPTLLSGFKKFSLKRLFKTESSLFQPISYKDKWNFMMMASGLVSDNFLPENIEKKYHHTDIHIIGGGLAGLYAAVLAASAGLRVIISDRLEDITPPLTQNDAYNHLITTLYEAVCQSPLITRHTSCRILPFKKEALHPKRLISIKTPAGITLGTDNYFNVQVNVIHTKATFIATGLKDIGCLFQGMDFPNIFTTQKYQELYTTHGIAYTKNIVLYTNNDKAYDILYAAHLKPEYVSAIIDMRDTLSPAMKQAQDNGFTLYTQTMITGVEGKNYPEAISFQNIAGGRISPSKSVECNVILHSAGQMLDIDLFADDSNIIQSDYKDGIFHFSTHKTMLPENYYMLGYAGNMTSHHDIITDTHHILVDVLKKMGHDISLPAPISEELLKESLLSSPVMLSYLERKKLEKIYFSPDINMAHLRDDSAKTDDIFTIAHKYTDTKLLYHDTEALLRITHEVIKGHDYKDEKANNLILDTVSQAYQNSILKQISNKAHALSVISRRYPPLYDYYVQNDISFNVQSEYLLPITADMYGDKKSLKLLYDTVIRHAGIQDLCYNTSIFGFFGPDVAVFLEHITDISVADLPTNYARSLKISLTESISVCAELLHYDTGYYFLYHTSNHIQDFKNFMENTQSEYHHLRFAMSNLSEEYGILRLVGAEAPQILKKLRITLPDIQEKTSYAKAYWWQNIPIYVQISYRYNLPFITILTPTDMITSVYATMMDVQNQSMLTPYSSVLEDIIKTEVNQTDFEDNNVTYEAYPTKAFILPLHPQDNFDNISYIYENDSIKNDIGVILRVVYSPKHDSYMALIRLKGALEEWENRIITAFSDEKMPRFKVKIIAPSLSSNKELEHG